MRFDIEGRTAPTAVILYPGGVRRRFDLPYSTNDPVEIELLGKFPLTSVVPEPKKRSIPEPLKPVIDDPKPAKEV